MITANYCVTLFILTHRETFEQDEPFISNWKRNQLKLSNASVWLINQIDSN